MALPSVVVAMSGGVDSSVAAARLQERGYQVTGVTLNLWTIGRPSSVSEGSVPDSVNWARKVADKLRIQFFEIDAANPFHSTIVKYFLESYSLGETPNPCMVCNPWIKWKILLDYADSIGAEYLATGHYARISLGEDDNLNLQRAVDLQKDQSYFLSLLTSQQLKRTILPLGTLYKTEVRDIARLYGLPVADRSDSQDLCFLGGQDYRLFLRDNLPEIIRPGPILTEDGVYLGNHEGLAFYTIGQRKAIGISSSHPLYVLRKEIPSNTLIVGPAHLLGQKVFTVHPVHWISGKPPKDGLAVQIKIRYRAPLQWAILHDTGQPSVTVELDQRLRDITPGQFAVFYDADFVLGGGKIMPEHQEIV